MTKQNLKTLLAAFHKVKRGPDVTNGICENVYNLIGPTPWAMGTRGSGRGVCTSPCFRGLWPTR